MLPSRLSRLLFFFSFFHVNHSSFYYSHISQEIISYMHPPFLSSICTFHAVFMWRTAVPEHLNPSLLPRLLNPSLPPTFFLERSFHYPVIYRSQKKQHVLGWCKKKGRYLAVSFLSMRLCFLSVIGEIVFFTHFCQSTCAWMCHCLLCNYLKPLRCQSPLWSNYHI